MHALAQAWLSLQCKLISDVSQGIVILGDQLSAPLSPTASWPVGAKKNHGLSSTAQNAVSNGKGLVQNYDTDKDIIACPIIVDKKVLGVVALETRRRDTAGQQALLQMLSLGALWLTFLLDKEKASHKDRLISVIELVSTTLDQNNSVATTMKIASELATKLRCDRVSIGFKKKQKNRVTAISKTARFDRKSQVIRDLASLMDEACDQDQLISLPDNNDEKPFQIKIAHKKFLSLHGDKSICTIPMTNDSEHIGAIVFERSNQQPFNTETEELILHFGQFIGPILDLKLKNERGLLKRALSSGHSLFNHVFGSSHLKTKSGLILLILLYSFFSTVQTEYRISADARLEGSSTRAIVSPIDGYLNTAKFTAGDLIKKGDLLAKLSDKDLNLEKLKWQTKKSQVQKEYRSQLAIRDRTKAGILNAQIQQADAQIELVDKQLKNTEMISPFNGIIISGDLDHKLGSPVEKGQVLFEITPQNNYQIVLEVDETDITEIHKSQTGHLKLSAMPQEQIPFLIEKITPVSSVNDGRNFFLVEASLEMPTTQQSVKLLNRFRPGMQGVAKVNIDERKLIWIWTHKLTDWIKLWWWSWQS
ncbi:MAG: HlyD family efflux transporter periplasmic adaptor subunit [Gammaproteobacteria bacterium]